MDIQEPQLNGNYISLGLNLQAEADNKVEAVDEDRKSANELLRKLRAENNAFKVTPISYVSPQPLLPINQLLLFLMLIFLNKDMLYYQFLHEFC